MRLKKLSRSSPLYDEVSKAVFYLRFSTDGEWRDWIWIEPNGNTAPYNKYPSAVKLLGHGDYDAYFVDDRSGRLYRYE